MNQITYKTKHNCEIKIFYLNQIEDTYSPSKIEYFLDCILFNLNPYISPNFLDGLKIEVWNTNRKDIPIDDIGKKEYVGLTWGGLKLIKLEIFDSKTQIEKDQYVSNLLSHELGHYFQTYIDYKNSHLKSYWQDFRGVDKADDTDEVELFAEDFRLLFGSPLAKNSQRGKYIQATNKLHLAPLMLLIYPLNEYYKSNKKDNWFYEIKNLKVINEQSYFGIMFYEDYSFFKWNQNKWVCIDLNGIYYYLNDSWVKIRKWV